MPWPIVRVTISILAKDMGLEESFLGPFIKLKGTSYCGHLRNDNCIELQVGSTQSAVLGCGQSRSLTDLAQKLLDITLLVSLLFPVRLLLLCCPGLS